MNHFSVYSSVVLNTFTLLCNHYHHVSPELFHLEKLGLWPILQLGISSSFQPLATTIRLSASMNLTACKWWQPPLDFLLLWIWLFQIPHISGIIQYLSFCNWLILCSIMSSRFIWVVLYFKSFSWKNLNIYKSRNKYNESLSTHQPL